MEKFIDLAYINRAHPLFPKEEKKNGKMHGVLNPENNVVIALRTQEAARKLQRRWRVLHGRDMVTGLLPTAAQAEKTLEVLATFVDERREHETLYAPGSLEICPENEPKGEGNGWEDCSEEDATGWGVYHDGGLIEHFSEQEDAQDFVDDHTGDA